ncbi:MAG TPA: minor capsid protein, partial [Solirubrobacterales bacterium]|nr:minor capsid protein [Solirubrobacterales bacterium]
IAQHEANTLDYLQSCISTILTGKKAAGELANGDAPALAQAALGPAPARAEALVANSFNRLPAQQMARLVRNAADGRPLGSLLAEIAPDATQKVKDALLSGVARGAPVRMIAADVQRASGLALNRASLISRTETIRAYREVTFENYRASEVVTGWIWVAEVNACPVCSAEHGSEHSLDESLDSHPGCRCTALPKTRSWRELGFNLPDTRPQITPGPERFAALPQADRLAILGRSRFDAYERGEVTLEEMVRPTTSPRWGEGKRVATLAELGVG